MWVRFLQEKSDLLVFSGGLGGFFEVKLCSIARKKAQKSAKSSARRAGSYIRSAEERTLRAVILVHLANMCDISAAGIWSR